MNKMNQEQMGKIINMTQSAYAKIERNERRLCADEIKTICEYFHVSADWLLDINL